MERRPPQRACSWVIPPYWFSSRNAVRFDCNRPERRPTAGLTMGQLGTLSGTGTVTVAGREIQGVRYRIDIFQTSSRGRLKADGEIHIDPQELAYLAATISICSLELQDG